MPSPICTVQDGAGAATATTNGVNITPANTITIALAGVAAVTSWQISCVYTDETSSAATINSALTVNSTLKTATFTAPAAGKALIFQSTINGGLGPDGLPLASYTTTFGVFTLTAGGARVAAMNQTFEGDATYGWTGTFNYVIRNPSAAVVPTGTGLRKVVAGVEPGAASLLVDADVSASAAIALTKIAVLNQSLALGTGFVSFGTTPSTTGSLRWPAAGGSVLTLLGIKNTSAADTPIIRTGAGDVVIFGNVGQDTSLVSTMNGFVAFGSGAAVPTTGHVRLPNAGTIKFRNAAGSADRTFVTFDAGDVLRIGDNTGSGHVHQYSTSWGVYNGASYDILVTQGGNTSVSSSGGNLVLSAAGGASLTAASGISLNIGGTTYLYVNSVGTAVEVGKPVGGLVVSPDLNGLRLTVSTGAPLPTADVASASTLYLTPYRSGSIALFSSATLATNLWFRRDTAEINLALSGLTTGKNYDVYTYWTGSAVALELSTAWTSDTVRATALVLQDGVWVKNGDPTRRYVGTIRAISATQTTDTSTQRFVYNEYNQYRRHLLKTEATATWTYASTTVRQTNGATANKVEVVVGNPSEIEASAVLLATAGASGIRPIAGIGIDSTTVSNGISFGDASSTAFASETNQVRCEYDGVLTAGYHAINWLESIATASSETLYGTSGGSTSFLRARMRL